MLQSFFLHFKNLCFCFRCVFKSYSQEHENVQCVQQNRRCFFDLAGLSGAWKAVPAISCIEWLKIVIFSLVSRVPNASMALASTNVNGSAWFSAFIAVDRLRCGDDDRESMAILLFWYCNCVDELLFEKSRHFNWFAINLQSFESEKMCDKLESSSWVYPAVESYSKELTSYPLLITWNSHENQEIRMYSSFLMMIFEWSEKENVEFIPKKRDRDQWTMTMSVEIELSSFWGKYFYTDLEDSFFQNWYVQWAVGNDRLFAYFRYLDRIGFGKLQLSMDYILELWNSYSI